MANILSIETSTNTCSIALHHAGVLISAQDIHLEKSHSEYLMISIKNLLEVSNLTSRDLQAVAIAKGPGSYTGLRIGTSTAKGLCYASDIPLIAVNTLKGMARGVTRFFPEDVYVCPMIDARRMEVYCAVFDHVLEVIKPTDAVIVDENAFHDVLENYKVVFFGNGMSKCREILSVSPNALFVEDINPSSIDIGYLAWQKYQNKQFEDLAYFEPFYLKDFIAKKPSRKI